MKSKINTKIIGIILTLSVVFGIAAPSFYAAYGQAPGVTLDPNLFRNATTQALCGGAFYNAVVAFGQAIGKNLRTGWYADPRDPARGTCRIIEQMDPRNQYAQPTNLSQALEARLRTHNTPINATTWLAEYNRNNASNPLLSLGNMAAEVALGPFTALIFVINSGLAALASGMGFLFSQVAMNTGIVSENLPRAVSTGWLIVRDFMNMFFILVLIVIALGTILRFEGYNYRRLLINFILMALLVNFSKAIAVAIIGVFNVITNLFLTDPSLSNDFLQQYENLAGSLFEAPNAFSRLGTEIMKFVLVLFTFFTYAALAVLFVVRMVALWILIILSPIAYALNILPVTKKYAQQWWSKFFEYLIWAPVALFFISLGQNLLRVTNTDLQGLTAGDPLIKYMIAMVFMWAALMVAKGSGVAGAAAITGFAVGATKTVSSSAGKYMGRGKPFTTLGDKMGGVPFVGAGLKGYGNMISSITRAPGVAKRTVKELGELDDRKREKEIKERAMSNLMRSGVDLDKKAIGDLSKSQMMKIFQSDNYKQISSVLEHGGKDASEVAMQALQRGLVTGLKGENFNSVKESIYRSYLTNKGVREVEFEQNKDKYMALPGKVVQVGNLKPEDNNDFDKVLKDKSRVDNIKPYVYIPTRKELENMEVEDIRKFNDPNDLAKHAEKVRKVPATVVATAAPTTPATPLETATKQMDDLFPGLKDSAEKAKAAADTQAKAAENLANAQNKAAAAADDEDEE